MRKEKILEILENAKDGNGAVPMRLVRTAFDKLPEPCEDTISRQAAIDAVDAIGHIATMPDGDKCIRKSAAKYTLSMLPPAEPEQRWIPCSERLPELDEDGYSQKVLACFGNYSGCDILEYRETEGIGKWYIGDMDDSPEDIGVMVLAWMPLPEPYKEGDDTLISAEEEGN